MSCREPKITAKELSSRRLKFRIYDADDNPMPGSSIGSLTMTLVNDADNAPINNRVSVEIKSDVDEEGWLVFWLQPEDNVIVDPDAYPYGKHEPHKMLLLLVGLGQSPVQEPTEKMIYVENLELMPVT